MIWYDIKTAPKNKEILIGKYYIDDCNGYSGDSRWLWICQGYIDECGFFDAFNDDLIEHKHMIYARLPTHWCDIPEAP